MTKTEIEQMLYWYRVPEINFVYDADTITAFTIDYGFGRYEEVKRGEGRGIRLRGIDAAELSTPKGKEARDYLKQFEGGPAYVRSYRNKTGKYGRYLYDLYCELNGEIIHINEKLVKLGFARKANY